MKEVDKSREHLIDELEQTRQWIAELEASETERKRLEEYLEKERKEFGLIVDSSPIIIFYKDRGGRFLRVNKAFAEALAIPQEKFLSKTVFDFYSAGIAQAMTDDDREVLKSGHPKLNIIEKYESASGIRWVKTDKIPIFDKDGLSAGLVGFAQDITEWKKAQENLLEGEVKYKELAESITDVFFALDEDLRYTYWNKASEELTGISAKDALGKRINDIFPDDEATRRAEETYRRTLATKKPQHFTSNFPIGGRDFVFEISTSPTAGGLCVYIRDITQRKRLEDALRESEQWYRLIFDNTPIGIGFASLDGKVITLNKAMETITGYSAEDFNRVNLANTYVYKADREVLLHELSQQGSVIDYPVRLKRIDGSQYYGLITSKLTTIGDKKFVQTILHDITERKKAEEALRESEERYRSLVELSPEAIFVAGEDKHVFMNSAGLKLLGASNSDQIIGKPVLDVIHPDYREIVAERMRESMETGMASPTMEEKFLRLDGTAIDVEVRAAPLIYQGKPAMQAVVRDISERKQAEESLRLSEQNFRDSIESSPLGIRIINEDGKMLYANRALLNIYGYSSVKDLEAVPNKRSYTAESYVEHRGRVKNRKLGEYVPPSYEISIVRKDGQVRCLAVSRGEVLWDGKRQFQVIYQDITDRKLAEAELRTKDYAMASSISGILVLDLDGVVLYANQAYLDIWLYRSKEEVIGHNIEERAANKELAKRLLTTVRTKGEWKGELETSLRDSRTIDVLLSASLVRNEKGVPIAIMASTIDITERKQAEEQVQQEKDRAQRYLDIAGVMLVANDAEGRVSLINSKGCQVLGYGQEEIIGKNWFDTLIPERVRHEVKAVFNKLMTGEVEPVEYFENPVLNKNGEERIIAWHNVILKDGGGNIIGTLSSGEDITERKKAEEALQASEARYRLLAENVRDVIWATDMDLRFTYVSPSVKYLGDRTAEEVMSLSIGQLLAPSSQELATKAFAEELVMANSTSPDPTRSRTLEVEFLRGDGSVLWAELKMNFIRDTAGRPVGILGVMRDISERKKAEEERRQFEQKAQLASRLASVGELAAGVAHEINNPLTGVIGYSELLMQEDVPERIKNDLEIINNGAKRVADVVKGLLKFARQTKPERTIVDINEIIEVTLRLRAYELETSNIKVTAKLAPDLPLTVADAGQLQQVFLNLLINAEMEMGLAHGKGKLIVKTEHTDNTIRITFKDDGPGIAKENLERIFEPFFSTREAGKGTGLGLSICHGIITEHGGRIWAESRQGKGATFIVELPVVAEKRRSIRRQKTTRRHKVATKAKILVVDDEPVVRQLVTEVLTAEGHEVETTADGEDALNRIKNNGYSIILVDMKLPGISGGELYERVQMMAGPLAKRVVLITGDVMGADTEAFITRTKVPCITKPFDVKQLKAEIRRLLASYGPKPTPKSKVNNQKSKAKI
jgi:PAS domain S-box-containing protein